MDIFFWFDCCFFGLQPQILAIAKVGPSIVKLGFLQLIQDFFKAQL